MPINYDILNQSNPDPNGRIVGQIKTNPQTDNLLSGLQSFGASIYNSLNQTPSSPVSPDDINGPVARAANSAIGMFPKSPNTDSPLSQIVSNSNSGNGIWDNASKELGLSQNDPTMKAYLDKANPGLDPTNTPWCAGFVGSVLNASGLSGTGSLTAKSYLKYGTPTDRPNQGDIVVFNDLTGNNDPAHGHVGFVQSIDPKTGMVTVLGGNQGHGVSIKQYPLSSVAGFRVPPSGQQVKQFAQANNIQSPQQLSDLTKDNNDEHPELKATVNGIVQVESGGDFKNVSKPSKDGDRAYGYSQIMGKNIPSWTREALGHPMTPTQYLNDPEAQKKTTEYHINKMLQSGHSPQDVASMWFTGRPLSQVKGDPKDAYGTSNSEYQKMFNKNYLKAKMQLTSNNEDDGPLEPAPEDIKNSPHTDNDPQYSGKSIVPDDNYVIPNSDGPGKADSHLGKGLGNHAIQHNADDDMKLASVFGKEINWDLLGKGSRKI